MRNTLNYHRVAVGPGSVHSLAGNSEARREGNDLPCWLPASSTAHPTATYLSTENTQAGRRRKFYGRNLELMQG